MNQEETTQPAPGSLFNLELVKRILSAIVLAALTLGLTWGGFESFLSLCAIMGLLLVWEWAKLTNNDTPLELSISAGAIALAVFAFVTREWPLLLAATIGGIGLSLWATHYWWRSKWSLLGLFYITLPILSLIYLRKDPDYGFFAVIFILLVVWASDTAAYFAGRHFGGAKLAPQISPSKTWSGATGGLFAGLITGVLFAISIDAEPIILGLIAAILSAAGQLGDLVESAIKRHFGVKDSSGLIPGHGGLLDRLDGIIFASVVAALIAIIRDLDAPAQALLLWTP